MNTGKLTTIFRTLGLMHTLDKFKYQYQKQKNKKANLLFAKENPDVVLPPDYMMFESFKLDYRKYYETGRDAAKWIMEEVSAFTKLENKNILDWGCGPARVVRHLPDFVENNCRFFGTDYNPETIAWCKSNVKNISFHQNKIDPSLVFEDNFFGAIYGISIFTHLSEANHLAWYNELMRVSQKGCILFLTMQGEAFRAILTDKEKVVFDKGQLITRGKVLEGHRVYSAFHPPAYVRSLFGTKAEILKHQPGTKKDWGIEQDFWILKKK